MKTKTKNHPKLILIILCIFSLSTVACKKHSDETNAVTPDQSQKEDIIVKNGRLAFKDRTTYESTIIKAPIDTTANAQKTTTVALRSSNYSGFTSMLDAFNNSSKSTNRLAGDTMSINDVNLAALVNTEGIIEIGEWIIKINPSKSLVTVLNEKDENSYQDFLNDVANPKIYQFSTNDDVLDLLEEGEIMGSVKNNRVSILCGGGAAASSQSSPVIKNPSDNRELSGFSAYKKFGVYFHLYTTVYLTGSQNSNLIINHKHAYYYKTNCKNYAESGPTLFTNDLITGNYNYTNGKYDCAQEIYMSTRGLHDYVVMAQYGYGTVQVTVPTIEQH